MTTRVFFFGCLVLSTAAACGAEGNDGGEAGGSGGTAGAGTGASAGNGGSAGDGGSAGSAGAGTAGAGAFAGASTGGAAGAGGVAGSGGGPNESFVTYLGGGNLEQIRDAAADAQGNVYVAGGTFSAAFPTTPGAAQTQLAGKMDVFVTKFSPAGKLLWSTFVGGPNYDRAYAIEVDAQGNVYVAGRAGAGFPTTPGVVQPSFGGDLNPNSAYGKQDPFVLKLSPDGTQLVWSTYAGTDDRAIARDMTVDAAGHVYLAITASTRPSPHITAGAFQTQINGGADGALLKLAPDASKVIFGTYIGGSGIDGGTPTVRVDAAGHVYFLQSTTSTDAPTTPGAHRTNAPGGANFLLSKLTPDGSKLVYSTYFGGSGDELNETHNLWVTADGSALIAAATQSKDLPTHPGAVQPQSAGGMDAFVAKISADGTKLLACTYLGGSGGEGAEGVMADAAGNVYVGGPSSSSDLLVTSNALQKSAAAGFNGWVAKLTPNLDQVLFASYIGGKSADQHRSLAIDGSGAILSVGQTESTDFPVSPGATQTSLAGNMDSYVAKIVP